MKVLNQHLLSILFVAVCTTSLGLTSFYLHGSQIWQEALSIIFLSTVFVYSFHRLIKFLRQYGKERISRSDLRIPILSLLSVLSVVFIVPLLLDPGIGPMVYLLFGTSGILTIWYSINLPFGNFNLNLRRIPFAKVFIISGVWTIMTISIPLVDAGFGGNYWLLFAERFLFILALSIPFDIRDIEVDKREGLVTFPLVFGVKKVRRFAVQVMILFSLLSLYGFMIQMHSLHEFIALFLSGIFSAIVISRVNANRSANYFFYTLEGMSLLQFLLVYLSTL